MKEGCLLCQSIARIMFVQRERTQRARRTVNLRSLILVSGSVLLQCDRSVAKQCERIRCVWQLSCTRCSVGVLVRLFQG